MSKPLYLLQEQNFKRWFPPHMSKGLAKMKETLRKVDCVIEVHDARIPLSGRNPLLNQALSAKPRVIVLNKVDMIQVIPACVELVRNSDRFDRDVENDINVMVIGVPNVGKSSLLNELRQFYLGLKPSAGVDAMPGYTKSVGFKTKVCDSPAVYLHDTPGIFQPKIKNMEEGMKLAVCNTVHDHLMGAPMVAEYLLFCLNEHAQQSYVYKLGLDAPTDSIRTVLKKVAERDNLLQNHSVLTGTGRTEIILPDYDTAARRFLTAFRLGHYGKFILDKL